MFNVGEVIQSPAGNKYKIRAKNGKDYTLQDNVGFLCLGIPELSISNYTAIGRSQVSVAPQVSSPPRPLPQTAPIQRPIPTISSGDLVRLVTFTANDGSDYSWMAQYGVALGGEYEVVASKGVSIYFKAPAQMVSCFSLELFDVVGRAEKQQNKPQVLGNPIVYAGSPCRIVKNSVLGREFLYCREHDEEADSGTRCRRTSK